jgi:hypothetical protein
VEDDIIFCKKILDRLQELKVYAEEEKTEINGASLVLFLNFLKLMTNCIEDQIVISLTPENEIYATWEGGVKYCLRFRKDNIIKFIVT